MREKVPLRVKGLVINVSIPVDVLLEGGYASRWVGSGEEEGMVKDGGGGISGETQREEGGEVEGEEGREVEGALVELAREDSAMYWSHSGMMVGFTAALRSPELSPGQ